MSGVIGRMGRTGRISAQLRSSIALSFLSVLDPRVTYSRAGAATAITLAGMVVPVAANAPQITDAGLLVEPARTNKVTAYNANPVDLTGVSLTGDEAATLTLVDDAPALAAAGLAGIVSNGQVIRLDNSAGSGDAGASPAGATGNTANHSVAAWVRGSGAGYLGLQQTPGRISFTASAAYERVIAPNFAATASSRAIRVVAQPGAVIFFILPQLEQAATVSSPIITAGSAATRAQPVITTPVPAGRTGWLMRFRDGSTASGSGLTPGATFDIYAACAAAGKGGVGAELQRLEWT